MRRYRLPAVWTILGLAGNMAVTAFGNLTQTGVQTGASAPAPTMSAARSASTKPGAPASSSSASSVIPGARAPSRPVAASTVLFDCLDHAEVEPADYILTCADANSVLARLVWTSWTARQAVATGVDELNDCTPDCAAGTFRNYPVVVTFWRSQPVPGHSTCGCDRARCSRRHRS